MFLLCSNRATENLALGTMLHTMRRLYPRGPANRGICVDANGAMLGPDRVLVHRTQSGFRPLDRDDASQLQKCVLDTDREDDWLFRQCRRISDALGRSQLALAQIYGLRIPIEQLDGQQLKRLPRLEFGKAGFNPDQPRLPKGDARGGEWTTGDGGGVPPSLDSSSPIVEGRNPDQVGGHTAPAPHLDPHVPDHIASGAPHNLPGATEATGGPAMHYAWLTPSGASIGGGANTDLTSIPNSDDASRDALSTNGARVDLPASLADLLLLPAAYQGHYHDHVVELLRLLTVQGGGAAVTHVPLTSVINGTTAIADLIVSIPGHGTFIIEVKTGESPQFTDPQRAIYAWAPLGWHLTSPKIEIGLVGLKAGEPLPPLPVLIYWASGPGREVKRWWVEPEFVP